MTRRIAPICCMALLVASSNALAAYLKPVVSGLSNPVFLTHAGDGSGRLFVVEQPGVIKVLAPAASSATVFLDITGRVLDGGERGLLGLAFHPQYASNGRFFVNYTREPDGATVIAEYHRSSNPGVAGTAETVLLTIAQPFANHNGGMIAFGPDGYLYIGMGDGGSSNDPGNRSQNISDLLGKVLRIDVDSGSPYGIPADNPFAGATPGADEIYAVGVRNPFRFSFDRGTGQLFVGDVGQGALEEIDIVTAGANLGWRVFEGTRCTGLDPLSCAAQGFTPPIIEYAHTGGRCSVTGGYVYRGTQNAFPSGTYLFADFCTGEIFTSSASGFSLLIDTALSISSFGEDESGELYVLNLGGTVHRLVSDSGAQDYPSLLRQLPDFDGQRADVFWRHTTPGVYAFWLMNGGAVAASSAFAVGTDWSVAALGDVDGEGTDDILWRSASTGAVGIWFMTGGALHGTAVLGVGPGWDLVGTGDLNGDGRADILWRSVTAGTLGVWFMNGATVVDLAIFGVGPEWTLAAIGDVNGDGRDDVHWRYSATARLVTWLMNGRAVQGTAGYGVGAEWDVTGIGDFNGDGTSDLLWHQPARGSLVAWFMSGGNLQGTAGFGAPPGWVIAGLGDMDGDGKTDLLWRQAATGLVVTWFMDGGSARGTATFSVGTAWTPVGTPQ